MKHFLFLVMAAGAITALSQTCAAQASGNVAYGAQQRNRPQVSGIKAGSDDALFIDAYVLANIPADEFTALFGLAQEGKTVAECNQKIDAQIQEFTTGLKKLGIGGNDVFVDYITQNKIYDYEITGNVARERIAGFQIKKNIAVHFKNKNALDEVTVIASRAGIYDLIKVNYIVTDIRAVRTRLLEEASRIVKEKADRYGKLFDNKFRVRTHIFEETYNTYFPSDQYASYQAFETGQVDPPDDEDKKYAVIQARKSATFFFNPLNNGDFDHTINPVVIEPIVQFTLYLKVRYEVDK